MYFTYSLYIYIYFDLFLTFVNTNSIIVCFLKHIHSCIPYHITLLNVFSQENDSMDNFNNEISYVDRPTYYNYLYSKIEHFTRIWIRSPVLITPGFWRAIQLNTFSREYHTHRLHRQCIWDNTQYEVHLVQWYVAWQWIICW